MLADDSTFREEVTDLRAEIMTTGVLAPMLILSWAAAFVVLFSSLRAPDWLRVSLAALPLALGLMCVALKRPSPRQLSMWLCATGLFAWATLELWIMRQPTGLIWLAAACIVATLVASSPAGWISAAAATGLLVALANTGAAPWLTPPQALIGACAIASLVWLMHSVSRILFRTLRWMQHGYFEAREHAQRLSEQSAELGLALKSLKQTSFALEQANEHLQIAVKYAEDARRSKQEFAANISHELRTPLNLIIGFADVLLRASSTYKVRNLPPGMLADINVIHRNANHLLNLVNDILDLSQMDVNHMTIVREPMRVREFIESSLEDFRELIHERGLTLSLDIAPDLPDVYADQTRIRQVLLNLVANALRFTHTGGITIRAALDDGSTDKFTTDTAEDESNATYAVDTFNRPPAVIISVSDTGIGIAPNDLRRIFEPFTQLDGSLGRQHGGTGLGLTISKQFVQLHGGRMWVESALGVGSTFSFSLPLHIPAPESPTLSTQRRLNRRAVGTLAVIEPGVSVARILEHNLEGISITRAPSLDDLIAQQPDLRPEAFIVNQPAPAMATSMAMLDKPGAGRWPAEWRRAPIFHCYLPSPEVYLHTEQVCAYLMKPITQDQFDEAIERMLKRHSVGEHGRPIRSNGAGNSVGNRVSDSSRSSEGKRIARILLVEDDEDALRLLGRMLRATPRAMIARCGLSALVPIEARSGEQALEILQGAAEGAYDEADEAEEADDTVDGVILDLGLGAVSGQDVLRVMAQDERLRHVPVCVVSGQQLRSEALVSSHLAVLRPGGLTARELVQSVIELMPILSPGLPPISERTVEPEPWPTAAQPAAARP